MATAPEPLLGPKTPGADKETKYYRKTMLPMELFYSLSHHEMMELDRYLSSRTRCTHTTHDHPASGRSYTVAKRVKS